MVLRNLRSDLLNVDELSDVHVVVTVADVRPHRLNHLSDHRHDDVPPGQRQRLTVEQLLQQCHHVAVVGRADGHTIIFKVFWHWFETKYLFFFSCHNFVQTLFFFLLTPVETVMFRLAGWTLTAVSPWPSSLHSPLSAGPKSCGANPEEWTASL